ncbi:protein of unknown function DUF324 [Carboxydothermus islandicus]|uniref:CRISPR type III-associated protein domain-containing protein n=1 Tax=Carboxydothermus islandicus TaxID=661089 RepID=A0A1L8D0E7_9THEO|nr:RAMP superfamily CRISPR-associated protein [Carboxydothermus islandicus]GAV24613.1 protein of unknown function DUF324 [Carboxydothermus islandicus]
MSNKIMEYSDYIIENKQNDERKIFGFKSGGKKQHWFKDFEIASILRYAYESVGEVKKYRDSILSFYHNSLLREFAIPDEYFNQVSEIFDPGHMFQELQLKAWLPPFSFAITLTFTMKKPYFSRDDTNLYVIDNPLRKDWVYKIPYIAPGQWKGTLHAAMVRLLADWWHNQSDEEEKFLQRRLGLVRLFGNEQEVDGEEKENFESFLDQIGGKELAIRYRERLKQLLNDGHRRGRLMFYPTFFQKMGLTVINPHDRESGAGTQPIYFEIVPEGASGNFSLLYVPFDRIGGKETETAREMAEDLSLVAEGLKYLFTEFGFGAKTSSGFGLAEVLKGKLAVKLPSATQSLKSGRMFENFAELLKQANDLKTFAEDWSEGGGRNE